MRHHPSLFALFTLPTLLVACTSNSLGGSAHDGGFDGGEAPVVTIEFSQTCPAFTPCAGDPQGGWTLASACIEPASLWPGAQVVCPTATVSSVSGTVSGTLSLTATVVRWDVSQTLSGSVTLPAACLTHGADCSYLRDALAAQLHATVSCAGSTVCECSVNEVRSTHTSSPLSLADTAFTTDPGTASATTYDFCVDGDGLHYRQSAGDRGSYTAHP